MSCTAEHLLINRIRRDTLRAEGACINGRHHGAATRGRLCESCRLLHRYGPSRRPAVWQRVALMQREIYAIGCVDLIRA